MTNNSLRILTGGVGLDEEDLDEEELSGFLEWVDRFGGQASADQESPD